MENKNKNLSESQPITNSVGVENREPFNDAIRHFDVVHGFQTAKRINQIPRKKRVSIRLFGMLAVVFLVATVFWSIIQQ
ncbi:hypothetical protein EDD64_10689 [Effusibacillus lacus]|nr:hypothetical protein EDD64_10689 [Effusibacillus lacus]